MKILVTGKSGVGKSNLLKNYQHYSVDQQTRDVWSKRGSLYYKFVKETFGDQYVNGETINNAELGKFLFSNKKKLETLNSFVAPIINEWIENLPNKSIVEFAQYINHEESYKNQFQKIIFVVSKNPKTANKFNYIKNKMQPIEDININYDYIVDNTNYKGRKEFDQAIKKALKD